MPSSGGNSHGPVVEPFLISPIPGGAADDGDRCTKDDCTILVGGIDLVRHLS